MTKASLNLLCIAFFAGSIIQLNAQTVQEPTNGSGVVTSAVPFLRISPDARAGAMGDVGIATAPDANASFWNLSKVHFTKHRTEIGVTYTPWLKDLGLNDVYLATLGAYHKLDEEQALAASIRYFSLGSIQFTDFAGNNLNESRPREVAIDFGYTRKLNNKLALGVALRYINSQLANGAVGGVTYRAGNAISGDISIFRNGADETGKGFSWGVVLSNLGSRISYTNDAANRDFIPANLGVGFAYTTVFDETSKLTLGLDINKLLVPTPPALTGDSQVDAANLAEYRNQSVVSSWFKSFSDGGGFSNELKEFQFSVGAEFVYQDQFALRAGYFYEDKDKGNRKYFTAGAGLKYNVIGINFSYIVPSGSGITRNPLSNTLRFGLTFDLSGDGNKN